MTNTRSSLRMAGLCGVAAAAVAAALVPTAAAAAPAPARAAAACTWSATELPVLPREVGYGLVYGTDGGSTFAGASWAAEDERAVLWRDGQLIDLGQPLGGNSSQARDVNRRGTAVGYSRTPAGQEHALAWRGQIAVRLPEPAGAARSAAIEVNDAGLAVGYVDVGDGLLHGALWWVAAGPPRLLRLYGSDIILDGLTEQGVVVGTRTAPDFSSSTAVVGTATGPLRRLPTPAGFQNATALAAAGRYAAGIANEPASPLQPAVRWELGRPRVLPGLPNEPAAGVAVNPAGQVAGSVGAPGFTEHAAAWQEGRLTVLPGPVGAVQSAATAITDDGRVAGWSLVDWMAGTLRPTVWTCD